MPTFTIQVPDGRKVTVQAKDQASAVAGVKDWYAKNPKPVDNGPGNGGTSDPNDPQFDGLALPGRGQPPGAPPVNVVPPNETFGPNSGSTMNPIPALAAAGNRMAGAVPIVGPRLQKLGNEANAAINTKLYGNPMTPEQSQANSDRLAAKNPIAATAGEALGATAPYALAAEVPVLAGALGFEGPLAARLGMTGASQYAINTGDNLAHGQSLPEAAGHAAVTTAATLPFALLGPGPQAAEAGAVKVLKREGIPVSAGQAKGSKPIMAAESQLGGSATAAFQQQQLSALTKAALRRAGVDAKAATPDVLQRAYSDIGDRFDRLAAGTTVKVDHALQDDVLKAADNYQQLVGQPAPVVENFMHRVGGLAQQNGGILRGDNYKVLVTDLRKAAEGSSSNEIKTALGQMRTALDDAVERHMGGKTREMWQKARQQYKNLIHVTDAVAGANEMQAKGYITPSSLRQAISSGDKRNYAKGYGDLNELSHAANAVIVQIPNSGTASRVAVQGALPAAAAAYTAGGLPAAASVAAGMVLPTLAGRAMLTAPGRKILTDGTKVPAVVARSIGPLLEQRNQQ
jgi:hypothetical protein